MTPTELHRLAGAIATLRPDWPPASLQTFLERHMQHRPLRDAAVALVACALDPNTATPARVLEPGPWWQMAGTRDVPRTANTCTDHPLAPLRTDAATGHTSCAGCWADRHGTPAAQPLRHRGVPPDPDTRRQLVDGLTQATPDDATPTCDQPPCGVAARNFITGETMRCDQPAGHHGAVSGFHRSRAAGAFKVGGPS